MKRRLLQIVVLLILGAIVNIAVAWGCSLRSKKLPGTTTVQRPQDYFDSPTNMLVVGTEYFGFGVHQYRFDGKYFGDLIMFGQGNLFVRTNAGWPIHALTGECVQGSLMACAISVPPSCQRPSGLVRANDAFLPISPLWPGFAINMIFYAAILWVMFFSPGIIKRTIRRRRGLCPACAYPIGTSPVCTECGKAIPGTGARSEGAKECSHA